MQFDTVLLPPRRAASIAQGLWFDRTINDDLDARVASDPDRIALTAVVVETGAVRRFTYRELATMADRIAVGLARLGVGKPRRTPACTGPGAATRRWRARSGSAV
jgi:cyclohexanecarboxylate-CoA ligase